MTLTLPLVTSTVMSPEVAVIVLPPAVMGMFVGALIVPLVRVIEVTLLIVGLVPVLSIVNALEAVTLKVEVPAMRLEPAILSGSVAVTPLTVMLVGIESELARVMVYALSAVLAIVPYLTALDLFAGILTT